jgi:thiopeptide-type bacteriocin biosynthesis protein
MKTSKRTFAPGSEWLFYKIYCGVTKSNEILIDHIYPEVIKYQKKGYIDKWFFIRYSDPGNHLRVRFHICNNNHGNVITAFYHALSKLQNDGIINRIVIDTYQREIERYDRNFDAIEDAFCFDSNVICELLKSIHSESIPAPWLLGFALTDNILSDFYPDIHKRQLITEELSSAYKYEFNFNDHNSKQFNDLFREYRPNITKILDENNFSSEKLLLTNAIHTVKNIFNYRKHSEWSLQAIRSLLHMRINRFYSLNQRLYELIIYTLLNKYYKSIIARYNIDNHQ